MDKAPPLGGGGGEVNFSSFPFYSLKLKQVELAKVESIISIKYESECTK